jgi:hypothetical protein
MNKSESIQNIATALSNAQAEFPVIKFDSINPFLKNHYASLGSVIETARATLAKYGLSASQLTFGDDGVIGVETVLMHSSGEWISQSVSMQIGEEKGKSSAQVAGSIITYLRRYALASMLGLYADEDSDGGDHKPAGVSAIKPKPEQESKPEQQPTTDTQKPAVSKYARPMDPEVLKEALQTKAAKAKPANEKQINLVRVLLVEHFADKEDERRQAQEYLTGHKHFSEIEPEMISALLDWMKPEKATDGSGAYVLNKDAKIELTMASRKLMEDNGQQTLEI